MDTEQRNLRTILEQTEAWIDFMVSKPGFTKRDVDYQRTLRAKIIRRLQNVQVLAMQKQRMLNERVADKCLKECEHGTPCSCRAWVNEHFEYVREPLSL